MYGPVKTHFHNKHFITTINASVYWGVYLRDLFLNFFFNMAAFYYVPYLYNPRTLCVFKYCI